MKADIVQNPERGVVEPRGCDGPCPDLTVDAVRLLPSLWFATETLASTNCNVEEGSAQGGVRKLLRFTTKVPNGGNGSLAIGDPSGNPDAFEWGACHGHWHFPDFSAYRLWNVSTYAQWRQLRDADPSAPAELVLDENPGLRDGLVGGHKQGFCLIDVERTFIVAPPGPSNFPYCTNQGISPNWADVYGSALDGQFIDVTGMAQGMYVLEIEANPTRVVRESDYSNNAAAIFVPIP